MTGFPQVRMRRLRQHAGIRKLVQETRFSVENLIYPLFVRHGRDVRSEIAPMPDIFQLSLDQLINEVGEASELGVEAVLLFGIPETKDPEGTEAYEPGGIIQEAVRAIKQALSEMLVITDVCLCEFTDHGHCGIIKGDRIDNDATLELLARMAVCQAEAGADIVAPSAMMDGQVGAIRTALDEAGYEDTPIMAYSAKYSSGFYGPFRIAAESAPQFGDRTGYQMDPPDIQQAMREIELDIQEGADIVMVKPALAYLDVLAAAKQKYGYPLAAYNVSGEYSMVKAAAANEWIDGRRITLEILTAIRRAGADMIITYHAKEVARWFNDGR
ncbi:MAG: porphobilinogen synthase [SAR202 cluster bacterium]|nr:porphobilinogen synthase [SAR202 cluster bacterium]MDP6302623.1 porphobilinogen synthase [SAR202 cluster bacterium]MDP7104406.1 porphobilinogen synthase [SAR202 cluster bacterium]MDP7223622.1 porphobilinogen synthase [SAR202 cluster bacterium]MDP7412911.1 porphobilinogen synthase [SAR202 cluster bacterium]